MRWIVAIAVVACVAATSLVAPRPVRAADGVEEIENPADEISILTDLVKGADGRLYLSWLVTGEDGGLRFARWEGERWSEARTIVRQRLVFTADGPVLAVLEDGTLAAYWLEPLGMHSYGVRTSLSRDGGDTWSSPSFPHGTEGSTRRRLSLVPIAEDSFGLFWVNPLPDDELRCITISRDGILGEERLIDEDGSQYAFAEPVAPGGRGAILARGKRSSNDSRVTVTVSAVTKEVVEVIASFEERASEGPAVISSPVVARSGETVVVAWFARTDAEAEDDSRILLRVSRDGGETFGPSRRVDDGSPLGRIDLAIIDPDTVVVSWLEKHGDGAELRVRSVSAATVVQESRFVSASASRNWFPSLAVVGSRLFLAWSVDPFGRVRTVSLEAPTLAARDFFELDRSSDGTRWVYRLDVEGSSERQPPVLFDGWIFERRALSRGRLEDAFNQYVDRGTGKSIYFSIAGEVLFEYLALGPERPVSPVVFDPPIPLLPPTFRVGSRWTWTGTVDSGPKSTATLTVESLQEHMTPTGPRPTIHVSEVHESGRTVDRWFAKGVGLIRERHRGVDPEWSLELESVESMSASLRDLARAIFLAIEHSDEVKLRELLALEANVTEADARHFLEQAEGTFGKLGWTEQPASAEGFWMTSRSVGHERQAGIVSTEFRIESSRFETCILQVEVPYEASFAPHTLRATLIRVSGRGAK